MENSGGAANDQRSGWFEVRKKHRSSSKASLHSSDGTGRFSGKYGLVNQQPSSTEKNWNLRGNTRPWISAREVQASTLEHGDIADVTHISNKDENDTCFHQKSTVKLGREESGCPRSSVLFTTNFSAVAGDTLMNKQKDNLILVPKIKWGDLDDDDFVLHLESNSQPDVRCSQIQDRSLVDKLENNGSLFSRDSSCTDIPENKSAAASVDICPDQIVLNYDKDVIKENCDGVSEISSKHVQEPFVCGKSIALDSSGCNEEDKKHDHDLLPGGETGTTLKLQLPVSEVNESKVFDVHISHENSVVIPESDKLVLFENNEPDTSREAGIGDNPKSPAISLADESIGSDLLVRNGNSGEAVIPTGSESLPAGQSNVQISSESGSLAKESQKSEADDRKGRSSQVVISHDIESLAAENRGSGILVETTVVDSVEGRGCPVDEMGNDKHSTVQSMTAPGEDVTGESKERFRERLWCFLFENLNRAVDELYLLCELECDVEQMTEAILVLEEAASDFKELTNRVKDFEHVKKSTSISLDGSPVTLKSDHRRPHALSWEVRRMTTSPHKAEILSSSLEAFKKIQQERAIKIAADNSKILESECSNHSGASVDILKKSAGKIEGTTHNRDSISKSRNQIESSDTKCDSNGEKRNVELGRSNKVHFVQNGHGHQNNSSSGFNFSRPSSWDSPTTSVVGKSKGENEEKLLHKKDKSLTGSTSESTHFKSTDHPKKQVSLSEKDKEKKISASWKSMNAWKEKRNWEDILSSPFRVSSRVSRSPGLSRKSAERARILHDKLMSPEKKKKTGLDLKKEAEEKHARAMRIRTELETERVQKLQRTSEKLNRVSEWQAVRTMKLREGMYARHQRSESRHEAFIAQVVKRAGDESSKVSEVRFITSLNEENKKLMLRQKLQDSELRRAEKLQIMKTKQKEDMAREEAVLERRKLIEAEKLQRLAETQRKKEEAQVRREEERKASSAAREARAIEQLRRREERAKAQQEEAELLAQKLAERLRESEQRRKFYLEQIKERASMDFRDQSSPLLRRSGNKEGQGRSTPTKSGEDFQENGVADTVASSLSTGQVTLQHSLKRRIKKIRQRLMAMKYEFLEPTVGSEAASIGYRTTVGTARAKIGRWLQELQRLRQARKEGAASIGLITADIVKFVDGKDAELQAARQAGLLDFIASALPASHTSRPEDCRVTLHFLKLLRVVLSASANRSYFLAQNLLPPIVPMLSSALENYIKIAASLNAPGGSNFPPSKTSLENFETISEVLENFLCTVCAVVGHTSSDERELQMQDGLLELLTAYQVIHRLRDLFALYDRPQVEGSPFPPSILLSIHLLVVLTSRPTTCGTIDWEHSLPERVLGFETQETKPAETAESTEDCRPPLPVLNDGTAVPPSDISDNTMLDELHNMRRSVELLSIGNGFEKSNQGTIELGKSKSISADASDESPTIIIEKDERKLVHFSAKQNDGNGVGVKQPVAFLLSAISDTGLVCLPSLLTAVLLQANNRLSSELGTYVLPSNFEEVATGVLKVLNNLALMDITFIQRMLARPDLKMEFFHLVSFLLSHCTSKWKAASDQVGLLLLESLSLLGYFSLFHPENQAVLRWGKSPTILHKVCDLPFIFFSDSGLMPILASTLVAACYGCEQNKGVIQQELSMDMLLSLLRSCKNALPANPSIDILPNYGPSENIQQNSELRKSLVDTSLRPSRYNGKSSRVSVGKGGALGSGGKIRSQRVYKATKACEEMLQKHKPLVPQTSVMLHCRFPSKFIDKAEQFFGGDHQGR